MIAPGVTGEFSPARYLPRMVLQRLRDGRAARPAMECFDGAVLFTDIVGFSRLTENFAAAGPEGAERLSLVLDTYFGRMTDIVCRWGGDVTDFVGDSIVAVWLSGDDPAMATGQAAACALELQRTLDEVIAQTALPLRQRLAVGAGELRLFVLCNDERSHWLLAGDALNQASDANYRADPGEVLLCPSAYARVLDAAVGEIRPGGEFHLTDIARAPLPAPVGPLPSTAAEPVLAFVPRLLLEHALAGRWPWLGEFRNVTVLFLGLTELDVAHPGALECLSHTDAALHRVLRRHGGTHLHFSADEKGVVSVSAFGLPQAAHENDAERALGAAIELIEGLREHGIEGSIGVTTGRAFYGDSGGSNRRRLGLVGTPINLAARLMSAAHGRVLCDAEVRRNAPRYTCSVLPPMTLKGIEVPVPVFEPRARADRQMLRFERGLVGRAPERARIADDLHRLQLGQGGMLAVTGEAGIGKSRLLAEAVRLAHAQGAEVLTAAGSAMEPATPYFPWRRVLEQLLPGQPAQRIAFLRQQLRDDERREPWLPLLEAIVPLGLPPTEVTRHMDSAGSALAIQELVCELLARRAAGRPMLLVLDDLHWIDAASCALLQVVHDKLPQLLIMVGARPAEHAVVPQVGQMLQSLRATLRLDTLDRDAIHDLACLTLEVRQAPPELVNFLWTRAGGHPFYIEELLIALRGARMLAVDNGECRLSDRFGDEALATMPSTLHGLIVSRVDRLSSTQQWTLKLASVIGREFALAALGDLQAEPAQGESLQAVLATLLQDDLLRLATTAVAPMYEFKHAILRDVLYDLLPFSHRRELHGRVAAWIEHSGDDLRMRHAELALHWEHAGHPQRALHHLERAGVQAVARYANRDAIAHLHRAQALAEAHRLAVDEAQHALWEGLLGEAHHELFEYASAARHFNRSLLRLGRPTPDSKARLAGALLRELGHQTLLRMKPQNGAAENDTAGAQRASHIHERLAEIAYFDNRPMWLLYHTLSSLNLAERCGAVRETVDGYAALSIGYLVAGLRRLSQFYNRRSLELAQQRGTPADRAYAHLVDMVYCATIGQWEALESSAAIALPIYRQLGAPVRWHQTQSLRYHADVLRGRFARGRYVLDEVRADLSRDTPAQVRSWILCSDMNITLACDEPRAESIEALAEVLTPELHRADRVRSQGLMAQAWLRLGEPQRALTLVDAALATLADDVPTAWHVTDGLAALAETCIDLIALQPDVADLRPRMDAACAALTRYVSKSPVAAPRAALVAARRHLLDGKTAAARKRLRQALSSAQGFEMPYSEAQALNQLASLEPDSQVRASLLERAAERMVATGAMRPAGPSRPPPPSSELALAAGRRTLGP